MPRNRFGQAAGFVEGRPRRLIELMDLSGEMRKDRAEIIHTIAQRMLRRREIRAGGANRRLQRLAAVHETIDHLVHASSQPFIRLDQGLNRGRGTGFDRGAQLRRGVLDGRCKLVLLFSKVLDTALARPSIVCVVISPRLKTSSAICLPRADRASTSRTPRVSKSSRKSPDRAAKAACKA